MDEADSPVSNHDSREAAVPTDLRSPRKQMFSDLPTPAYNQTTFQSFGAMQGNDTGMAPMQPTYASYQMAPQGDSGFGSLNEALRSPNPYGSAANGASSSRETKAKRRESGMLGFSLGSAIPKKASMSKLREEEGGGF